MIGAVPPPPAPPPRSPLQGLPVEFLGSFADATVRLRPPLPEIAFLGRSNVGKSSLLNALTGRRQIARVSRTPGKTSLLNVFRLPMVYFLDLPGYGYARASQAARSEYGRLIRGVLERRKSLTAIVWLLDVRHEPSKDDLAFGRLLAARGLPVLVALTKADKLRAAERMSRRTEFIARLGLAEDQVELTSIPSGAGIAELGRTILLAAGEEGGR